MDLDAGRLSVRQTLTVVNGRLSFQAPKTRTSRRTVPLPAVVVEELGAHQQRQEIERQPAVTAGRSQGSSSPPQMADRSHRPRWAGNGENYAHGNLDEHAAALARLGAVVGNTLPSTVSVNETTEAEQDRGNVG